MAWAEISKHKRAKNILVWGTNLSIILEGNIIDTNRIQAVIDNDSCKQGTVCCGFLVINPEEIPENAIILIDVTRKEAASIIKNQLEEIRPKANVYSCADFIRFIRPRVEEYLLRD